MFFLASTIVLPLVLGAIVRSDTFQNPLNVQNGAPCVSGAHIVGVRATGERPGIGIMQEIVTELKNRIPDSDQFAIPYPAAGIDKSRTPPVSLIEYSASETKGYLALMEHLRSYVTSCPASKIVLMGYSQGAHVVGDVLCGWSLGGLYFKRKDPIADSIKKQVRATIQFGDPTHRMDVSWHVGNSTKNGFFARPTLDKCGAVTHMWQSYCDADDLFCDQGKSTEVHVGYVKEYKDDVVRYVVGKVSGSSDASYQLRDYLVTEDL